MSQTSTIAKSVMTDRNATYKANDVIEIFIPPEDCPLINPVETYLKFLVQLQNPAAGGAFGVFAQPDDAAGAHSLIREIQIFDGVNNALLEQLDTWNNWTSKYFHYNQSPGLRNIRTLMEGQSKIMGDAITSQYFSGTTITPPVYSVVECCLPFHMSGILGATKVFPNILTAGLRLRITLADNVQALKSFVHQGVGTAVGGAVTMGWLPADSPSYESPSTSAPFGSGAAILVGAATTTLVLKTTVTAAAAGPPTVPALNAAPATGVGVPFCVGQEIQYMDATGVIVSCGAITAIGLTAAPVKIQLTFAAFASTAAAIGAPIWSLQTGVEDLVEYVVSNVELICSVVNVPAQTLNTMRQKIATGSVNLDYNTFNLYRSNLNARVPQPQVLLPTTEHRALSVYQFPQASTTSLGVKSFEPVKDGLTSYQYNIANRLTPNRRVSTSKVATITNIYKWDPIHMSELEKSLNRGKINVRFLALNAAQFGVGRELAKDGHSFDANTNEIRTQFVYSTAAVDNTKEKLLHSYLYHTRTLTISPGSVSVSY
tara:strand:+ start:2871 stop:4499 length:1629 start_codon:yes stop_codon:yes gene_type:complete